MTGDWVFGVIAVLTLLHGTALLYAYRRGSATDGPRGVDAEEYVTDTGVECPNCGERNGKDYRYCRHCVSELPARESFLNRSSTPESRRTL